MKGAMKHILDSWDGIPCPIKKESEVCTHGFTFSTKGTPEQQKQLMELLRTDKTITAIKYNPKTMTPEPEVILIREQK